MSPAARRLGLCVLLLSAPGRADDDAKAHNDRATTAFALGHYADAATEWERTFALKPQPALLYNAAQAHRLAGSKQRALLLYQNYLRLYAGLVSNAVEVEGHIAKLKAALESDASISTAPPVGPSTVPVVAPANDPVVASPTGSPPPVRAGAGAGDRSAALLREPDRPAAKRRSLAVPVIATVAGVLVVAGAGVGIGIGVASSSPVDPTPSLSPLHFGGN